MNGLPGVILGGDTFCDVFRALYDHRCYWRLTDPDYCVSVMKAAYDGGCRAFDFSFAPVREMFDTLRRQVDEPVTGLGNPTWLPGPKLHGKHLQYCRDRVVKTIVETRLSPADAALVRDNYRLNNCLVFGYDPASELLSDADVAAIELDEAVFNARLDELDAADIYFIGGTDADWLFSLGRADILQRMAAIVRGRGKKSILLCHYSSVVLPAADAMGLDVDGYAAPVNIHWSWINTDEGRAAVRKATKPVIAFMAFASGGLSTSLEEAALYLREDCGVSGVLFGTTKPHNARASAQMLRAIYGA